MLMFERKFVVVFSVVGAQAILMIQYEPAHTGIQRHLAANSTVWLAAIYRLSIFVYADK